MTNVSLPAAQGLYDPRYEHDACGVGFVVDLKNRKSHDIVRKAIQILDQPGAPRRVRLREQHRRRRRHPHADAARLPAPGMRPAEHPACRRRASTASAWSSCPPTRTTAGTARSCSRTSSARRARTSSAGAPCRPTTRSSARPPRPASRSCGRSSSAGKTATCACSGTDDLAFERNSTSSAAASRTPCASPA